MSDEAIVNGVVRRSCTGVVFSESSVVDDAADDEGAGLIKGRRMMKAQV